MVKDDKKGEYVYEEDNIRKVFYFKDESLKIDILSKIVYLGKKYEIHFPFNKNGKQKFDNIKEIVYKDLPNPLPRGIIKDYRLGYGFTKVLSPILYQLDKVLKPKKLVVSVKGKIKLDKGVLYLNYTELNKSYPKLESLLQRHVKEKENAAQKFLSPFFPKQFKKIKPIYVKGTLYSIISDQLENDSKKVSREDFDSILELTLKELKKQGSESKKIVLETREKIERRFIEDAISNFKKLSQRKLNNNKLEKDWEKFLTDNPWIISNLFATPVFFSKIKHMQAVNKLITKMVR